MRGEMWAMMLDAKRTLDDAITRLAPDSQARQEILSNKIYRELSSAVAGSQELSAIVKLYELHHERDFDVIVLDTPPSRNALDFLDAPNRMLSFLDGRALKVFIAPGGLTARLLGRSHRSGLLDLRAHAPAWTCSPTCRSSFARCRACSTASASAPARWLRCCATPTRRSWSSPHRRPIPRARPCSSRGG